MRLKVNKRKGLISGYKKLGPVQKFLFRATILGIILALIFFVYQNYTSIDKYDIQNAQSDREQKHDEQLKKIEELKDVLRKELKDLARLDKPLKSPVIIRNAKELNEAFPEGTILVWAKVDSAKYNLDKYLYECINYFDQTVFKLYISNDKIINFEIYDNRNKKYSLNYTPPIDFTEYSIIAVTWQSNQEIKLYYNGRCVSTQKIDNAEFSVLVKDFYIGSGYSKQFMLNGEIKELRLLKDALPDKEIKTIFNNLFNSKKLFKIGTPEKLN